MPGSGQISKAQQLSRQHHRRVALTRSHHDEWSSSLWRSWSPRSSWWGGVVVVVMVVVVVVVIVVVVVVV